jgi:tRNA A37 threonylcarbamoyltransferase TsaD
MCLFPSRLRQEQKLLYVIISPLIDDHTCTFYFSGLQTMKYTMSDVDSKIKQYEDKFKELGLAFQERAILETEITVLHILDNVENLGGYCHMLFQPCQWLI